MVMKHAKIAELKARLSEYLRDVRKGHALVVMDRNTPIARVVPYAPEGEALTVRRPLGKTSLQSVPLPPPLETGVDAVELLLEERRAER
jgi:prevent-host-death family protein